MSRAAKTPRWRRCREWLGMKHITRTQMGFFTLGALWVLYLIGTAVHRPSGETIKHSRSLLAASSIKGRLDAIDFDAQSAHNLRAIIRAALHPGIRDNLNDENSLGRVNEYDPTLKFIESVAAEIVHTERRVQCPWDQTLDVDLPHLAGQRYLLAANFRNNEELLPHAIVQFWDLLAILPEGSAFVSIYESGSTDSTGAWLEILRQMLINMRVPHRIIVGGDLTRAPNEERIEFLAKVRNAALEPLWLDGPQQNENSTSWFGSRRGPEKVWAADKVVFLNDVYFCAKDVVRLLLHRADLACGMDFDRRTVDQVSLEDQIDNLQDYLEAVWRLPGWLSWIMSSMPFIVRSATISASANEFFRRSIPMGFYDMWVGRDMNGAMFMKDEPYATDPYTLSRLPKGLPFPVKCCWNGLVAMDARPFTVHNVRMRSHKKDECAASECSLLCNDFLRLGYHKMLIDPSVRQAYNIEDVQRLYDSTYVKGIELTSWADVMRAPPVDSSLVPFRPYAQCCGLKPGNDMVDFAHDCSWENIMTPNFTASPRVVSPKSVNASSNKQADGPRNAQKLRGLIIRNQNI